MRKEIELEREILARKNSQLSFLNTLLSHVHKYLEIDKILSQAQRDLHVSKEAVLINFIFFLDKVFQKY